MKDGRLISCEKDVLNAILNTLEKYIERGARQGYDLSYVKKQVLTNRCIIYPVDTGAKEVGYTIDYTRTLPDQCNYNTYIALIQESCDEGSRQGLYNLEEVINN